MKWYVWKWWIFAWSDYRADALNDVDGRWERVIGDLWILTATPGVPPACA